MLQRDIAQPCKGAFYSDGQDLAGIPGWSSCWALRRRCMLAHGIGGTTGDQRSREPTKSQFTSFQNDAR